MPFFWPCMPFVRRTSLAFIATNQRVTFCAPSCIPAPHSRPIRMSVDATVHPSLSPRVTGDDDTVSRPVKVGEAPSPWLKRYAQADAEAPSDRSAHKEPHTRRGKHNEWIVSRHVDKRRIDGINRDVWAAAYHDLAIAAQVAKILRLLAHALHRIHYILLLRKKRSALFGCAGELRSHAAQHGRKTP